MLVFHFISFFKATSIFFSVILSSAEVASSNIKISGFFKKSRAIDILCFSPQESFIPLSQIIVLIPCGKSKTNSASALIRADRICFFVALALANFKLSSIDKLKSVLSCETTQI
jgi:hypothetical protein